MANDPCEDEEDVEKSLENAISDGGGCVETWETLSEIREETSQRRGFLRKAGIAGLVGLGATTSASSAAGEESDRLKFKVKLPSGGFLKVKELRGNKKKKKIEQARESVEYDELSGALADDGHRMTSEQVMATSVTISGQGKSYLIGFSSGSKSDGQVVDIAVSVDEGVDSRAAVTSYDEDGLISEVTEYAKKGVGMQTTTQDFSSMPSDISSSGSASVSSAATSFPSIDINCGDCRAIVSVVGATSCSLMTAYYCSIITSSIGPVGPISCATAVGGLCAIGLVIGFSNPQNVCETAGSC